MRFVRKAIAAPFRWLAWVFWACQWLDNRAVHACHNIANVIEGTS